VRKTSFGRKRNEPVGVKSVILWVIYSLIHENVENSSFWSVLEEFKYVELALSSTFFHRAEFVDLSCSISKFRSKARNGGVEHSQIDSKFLP